METALLFKTLVWRLRYKLSFADLAEMFGIEVEHFYFTREAIRQWEVKFAPLIRDELKTELQGKATTRWKIDVTLVKVNKKYHYLYRAIDSDCLYSGFIFMPTFICSSIIRPLQVIMLSKLLQALLSLS